jgi:glycosyltransferase involved in cell wall biosynthesis
MLLSFIKGGDKLKKNLRGRIDHYLRKKRKGITKLSASLSKISPMLELAVSRPVEIFKMSEFFIDSYSDDENYLEDIHLALNELLGSKKTIQEAANISLSVLRALPSIDESLAIDFGEKYISVTKDERAIKTMVNLYIRRNQKEEAIKVLELSKDITWMNRKKLSLLDSKIKTFSFEQHYMNFQNISYSEYFDSDKILIYADVNMNVIDGSSIWLASITETIANHAEHVHLLLKSNISRETVIKPLLTMDNVKIIEPLEFGIKDQDLNIGSALDLIQLLDGIHGGYRRVILRGFNLCRMASSTKSLHGRIWAYLTDYYEIDRIKSKRVDKAEAKELMSDFAEHFDLFLAQTEEIKQDLNERHNIPLNQIRLTPPMIPINQGIISKKPEKYSKTLKIGYAGKIAPEWGVRELITIAEMAQKRKIDLEIHIIGDKIHRNTQTYPTFHEDIKKLLQNSSNLVWHGGLPRDETIHLMGTMDICWGYRSKLLEDNTLELSTKILEYLSLGLPTIISKNTINERICGDDYPYFIDTSKEIFNQTFEIIDMVKSNLIQTKDLSNLVSEFTTTKIGDKYFSKLIKLIDHDLTHERKRIVLNGHDLKFIAEFESMLKKQGHDVRRDLWEWGEPKSIIRSKELAKWGEIIFSEWGLSNAVWYSQNITTGQSHFVRIHLQEINERARKFPPKIELKFVNKIIFVSKEVLNTAVEMFNWPKDKCKVIHNYVNTKLFDRPKFEESEFTLAIVGIVPQRKRLDRAVDLLRSLRILDNRWRLIIKGKLPHDYAFMHASGRKKELLYYEEQYEKFEMDHHLNGAVSFESFTPSLANWYRRVGYILSPSDFESFHYSIAEGTASGCVPVIWPWEGAEEFYPKSWIGQNHKQITEILLDTNRKQEEMIKENKNFISRRYSMETIFNKLMKEIEVKK